MSPQTADASTQAESSAQADGHASADWAPPPGSRLPQLVRGFWHHLEPRRKRQLGLLLILMVGASFAEVLSLGAVLPFLGVLTQPETVYGHALLQPLWQALGIDSAHALLLPITLGFIAAALLAGLMRLLLLYAQTKLSFAIGADFSFQIYRRTLYQPYAVHVARNSSEVISGVTSKVQAMIGQFLSPLLLMLSSLIIMLAILLALLAVDPLMSLAAFAGFGLIYGVITVASRRRLEIYSERIAENSTQVVKVLQEGLGGIRDVLIDGTQETYSQLYRHADIPLRHAQANSQILGGAPRFGAEALGMAFIAILAYAMARQEAGISQAITLLGALALGAQRLLPVLQQAYQSFVLLRSNRDNVFDALELLSQPIDENLLVPTPTPLPFVRAIELQHLDFAYAPHGAPVLHGLDLVIAKGSRTGFMGATGSGKSTLLDLIMGLLAPTGGRICIDGQVLDATTRRAWQRRIAHVPQSIYLSDASIAENIALGHPPEHIDRVRVRQAARQAQIAEHIESLPQGYDTPVGERGIRLSGGQRQRIGIARALYRQADVIIFDEATSALDNATERAVMDAIDGLGTDLTILMIAHRLTTLRRCDQIVELQHGRIKRVGTYDELVQVA
ncbi:ABC transporter ATP-binding protein [Castellaniella sp.]|uniref:ABC transporter ATP-binding protein n=1 Tax=Castellaniella sp. TaxID=1955812 RepID=UPI0035611908